MKRKRLWQTIAMNLKGGSSARARYLRDKGIFGFIGKNVMYQPRYLPLYPELIRLHNNVVVAAGVRLITHDASFVVLNHSGRGKKYPEKVGCIEVMDNVFIGANAVILPNVRIGENVIIGAGSVVTKDLEPNGVYAGSPARRIGSFEEFCVKLETLPSGDYPYPTVARNAAITREEVAGAWRFFVRQHRCA